MLQKVLIIFSFCFAALIAQCQTTNLANQYYLNGEYEKAAATYKVILQKDPTNQYYFDQYIVCLVALDEFDNAEKAIKQRISANPTHVQLYVTYGNLYERQFEEEKAELMYLKAIEKMPADINTIRKLADTFKKLTKFDRAIEVCEKGTKMFDNDQIFAHRLGMLYFRKGNISKMLHYYLSSSNDNRNSLSYIKSTLQRSLKEQTSYDTLRMQLYERIQDHPDNPIYPELLEWVFIQSKEYDKAFRQARSLDRALNEDGYRIVKLAKLHLMIMIMILQLKRIGI